MAKEKNKTNERLTQLDGLRFIMIIMVVISHFEFLKNSPIIGDKFDLYIARGGMAVDFFFLLSGFGIYYRSPKEIVAVSFKQSVLSAINRIKKVYPAYIISLLMGIPGSAMSLVFNENYHKAAKIAYELFCRSMLTPFLLQSLSGMTIISHALNGVCWFLSALFISYMFCPLFIKIVIRNRIQKKTEFGLVSALLIIFVLSVIAENIDNMHLLSGKVDDLRYGHPFIRCFYLLIGMYLADIHIDSQRTERTEVVAKEIIAVLAYCLYLIFVVRFKRSISNFLFAKAIGRMLDIAMAGLLLYSLSFGEGPISALLKKDKLVDLGNKSMYIFLFHYPIRILIDFLFTLLHLDITLKEWTYLVEIMIIILLTCISVSLYLNHKDNIEKSFNKLFDALI